MRHIHRRSDDADVIRARLRALLDDGTRGGWVPEDDAEGDAEATSWMAGAPQDRNALADDADEPADADGERPAGVGQHRAPGRVVRWAPGRRGARSLWTAGLLAALVVIGGTWLDRPRVEPVSPTPTGSSTGTPSPSLEVGEAAETSTTAVVAVVGLVARPGLVTVPAGARIADAVEAAGGFLPGADPAAVNLAAVVTDGQQIAVGVPGSGGSTAAAAPGTAGSAQVNLNTATAEELDALPGIGPVLAQRIVAHRGRLGHFRSVEELDDVPGIGPTIAAALVELVMV